MDKIAVIDIGSNSVRLMLCQDNREEQFVSTTRLGQGVQQRRLQAQPLECTISAIGDFAGMARARGFETIYAFATSAVRDAENQAALLEPVRERFALQIDILPGEVEAELAYLGAAQGRRAGVLDIGGASTELVAGQGKAEKSVSLQMGAVRLQEAFREDRSGLTHWLDEQFLAQQASFSAYREDAWLGIGGTITTLAAMEQGMAVYEPSRIDGFCLTRGMVTSWTDRLWELPVAQRVFPGLKPARADIIAHGALILERFLVQFGRNEIWVSTGDNLRGYIAYRKGMK